MVFSLEDESIQCVVNIPCSNEGKGSSMTKFFIQYKEHQELGVIFDPLYHIHLACNGSVHVLCVPWPSAPPIPTEEFNSVGTERGTAGVGLVWISMDMILDLWRKGWQNTDSPGPGVCWYKHTHMHTATWTDRQAAASLMGRLMEIIHGWINTRWTWWNKNWNTHLHRMQ